MTILIDADGCPVVDLTLRSAGKKAQREHGTIIKPKHSTMRKGG